MEKLGVGVAVAATAAATAETARAAPTSGTVHYGMVIDTRRCSGCHACSVACKSEFNVPLGLTRSWVEYVEKGDYPNVSRGFLPRLCNHCRHPACVDVCPTGATYKREEDGIVVVDEDICIGCKYCLQACPYDARFINPNTGSADKCDFCLHRVRQGVAPSCVNTCQGKARVFGDVNDPESEVARLIATNPVTVLRPGQGTEPMVFYIGADSADEHDRNRGWYVDVTTHRKQTARR
jgi:tetrathionate reductase subunit B